MPLTMVFPDALPISSPVSSDYHFIKLNWSRLGIALLSLMFVSVGAEGFAGGFGAPGRAAPALFLGTDSLTSFSSSLHIAPSSLAINYFGAFGDFGAEGALGGPGTFGAPGTGGAPALPIAAAGTFKIGLPHFVQVSLPGGFVAPQEEQTDSPPSSTLGGLKHITILLSPICSRIPDSFHQQNGV